MLRWIVLYPLACWIICKTVTSFSGLRLISIINLSLNKSPFFITHSVVIKHSAQSFRRAVKVLNHWVTSQPCISVHLNFLILFYFEIWSRYVIMASLEFNMQTKLSLNLKWSSCLCLLFIFILLSSHFAVIYSFSYFTIIQCNAQKRNWLRNSLRKTWPYSDSWWIFSKWLCGKITSIKQGLNSIWRSDINNRVNTFKESFCSEQQLSMSVPKSWDIQLPPNFCTSKIRTFCINIKSFSISFGFVFADTKIPNPRTQ